mmetsp:Transcript_64206/g.144826  ORF Transcript_64206/g.144826 Transcript_64206/m.144826 type:complete len:356 (-) Transcript_64206:125-1192(-)
MAAPSATASSGSTVRLGSTPKVPRSSCRTHCIRVAPPTKITTSTTRPSGKGRSRPPLPLPPVSDGGALPLPGEPFPLRPPPARPPPPPAAAAPACPASAAAWACLKAARSALPRFCRSLAPRRPRCCCFLSAARAPAGSAPPSDDASQNEGSSAAAPAAAPAPAPAAPLAARASACFSARMRSAAAPASPGRRTPLMRATSRNGRMIRLRRGSHSDANSARVTVTQTVPPWPPPWLPSRPKSAGESSTRASLLRPSSFFMASATPRSLSRAEVESAERGPAGRRPLCCPARDVARSCAARWSASAWSKSSPPRWASPEVALTSMTPPPTSSTLTSSVPPPRSNTSTSSSPSRPSP